MNLPSSPSKHQPVLFFALCLWSLAILFIRSETFVRWFDDPKEMVFYLGLFLLLITQIRFLHKKFCDEVPWNIISVGALIFSFYLIINVACLEPPLNEALAVVGKYLLFLCGLAAMSQWKLEFHLKWTKVFCVFLMFAVLYSFYFKRQDYFIEPFGYVPYYVDTLTLSLPFFFYFGLASYSRAQKVFFLGSIPVILIAITLSTRKSGFVTLGADLIVFLILGLFFLKRDARRGILLLSFVLLAGLFFSLWLGHIYFSQMIDEPSLFTRLHEILELLRSNTLFTQERTHILQRTWEGIQARPIWGWGYGSFRFLYLTFYHGGDAVPFYFMPGNSLWQMHPHNEPLYQAFEGGLVGVGILGMIFSVFLFFLLKKLKTGNREQQFLVLMVLIGAFSAFVIGSVNLSLTHPLLRFVSMIYLLIGYSLIRNDLPRWSFTSLGKSGRVLIFVLFMAFSLSSGLAALGYVTASYFNKKSDSAVNVEESAKALIWSHFLSPRSYDYFVRAANQALRQGDMVQQEDLWKATYEEFPFLPQTILEYSRILVRHKKIDEAFKILKIGHDLFPYYTPVEKFYQRILKRLENKAQKQSS